MSERQIEDIITLHVLKAEVDQLREEVRALNKSSTELVQAWNAAGNVVRFVKWLSSFVIAIGALYLFIKAGLGLAKDG